MNIIFIDNSHVVKNHNCFYTHSQNGKLILALKKEGHNVTFFQFEGTTNSICDFDLKSHNIDMYLQKKYQYKIISYLIAYYNLIKTTLKNDILYLYYPNSFRFIIPICVLFNIKYALYIRGMIGINSFFSSWAYKHASFIVEVGDLIKAGTPNIFIPKPLIPFTCKDIKIERNYSKSKNFLNILYLGRLDKSKGLFELLYAIQKLKDKGFRFKLNIVGDGDDKKELQTLSEILKISDVVKFCGPEFDKNVIAKYYIQSDVYILPSYHEGFPRTLYEAMIFGTPIITTLVGAIPDLMSDGFNCKTILPKDVDSILNSLESVFNDYSSYIEYAKNGFVTVRKVLSRDNHSDILISQISKL